MSQADDGLPLNERTRAVIAELAPKDRERLEKLIADAAAGQRHMLEQTLDEAVRMVPAPFRKRVQKLFLG